MKFRKSMIAAFVLAATGAYAAGTTSSSNDTSGMGSQSTPSSSQGGTSQGSASGQQGSTEIREAQQALKDKGYQVTVDGQMGPETKQALEKFQQQQNLSGNGELDSKTLSALGVSGGASSGSSGSSTSGMSSSSPSSSTSGTQDNTTRSTSH